MVPRPTEDDPEVEDVTLDVPPPADPDEGGKTHFGVSGRDIGIDNAMLPYIGQFFAAMILLIAITVPGGRVQNETYGIVAAVLAMIFALIGCALVHFSAMYEKPLGKFPILGELTVGTANAQFLFIWWFIAAGILTFQGPFIVTSNGYFAAWGGTLFVAMALVPPDSVKNSVAGLGAWNGLLVASIVQISAIPPYIGGDGGVVYALIIAIITLVAILAFQGYAAMAKFKMPFFALFSLLWLVSACLTTFRGPFLSTGNGYFSAWLGFVLCSMVAMSAAGDRSASES